MAVCADALGTFIASVVVLVAFVVVEQRVRWPLVNLALLRNSRFSTLGVTGTIANRLHGNCVLVDGEPAAGAWAEPAYRGHRIAGPVRKRAVRW
jgi:hypothetical protein